MDDVDVVLVRDFADAERESGSWQVASGRDLESELASMVTYFEVRMACVQKQDVDLMSRGKRQSTIGRRARNRWCGYGVCCGVRRTRSTRSR